MKKIGIIFAMDEELQELLKYLEIKNEYLIFDLKFYEGYIDNIECVLVESGVGKVNAARCCQILIDNMKVDYIFNIGVAGGISNKLNVFIASLYPKLIDLLISFSSNTNMGAKLHLGVI